jgi:hypothetical protein
MIRFTREDMDKSPCEDAGRFLGIYGYLVVRWKYE